MANAENMSPSCDCSVSLSGHSKTERWVPWSFLKANNCLLNGEEIYCGVTCTAYLSCSCNRQPTKHSHFLQSSNKACVLLWLALQSMWQVVSMSGIFACVPVAGKTRTLAWCFVHCHCCVHGTNLKIKTVLPWGVSIWVLQETLAKIAASFNAFKWYMTAAMLCRGRYKGLMMIQCALYALFLRSMFFCECVYNEQCSLLFCSHEVSHKNQVETKPRHLSLCLWMGTANTSQEREKL